MRRRQFNKFSEELRFCKDEPSGRWPKHGLGLNTSFDIPCAAQNHNQNGSTIRNHRQTLATDIPVLVNTHDDNIRL